MPSNLNGKVNNQKIGYTTKAKIASGQQTINKMIHARNANMVKGNDCINSALSNYMSGEKQGSVVLFSSGRFVCKRDVVLLHGYPFLYSLRNSFINSCQMDIQITAEQKQKYLLIESKGQAQTKEQLIQHCKLVQDEILKHDCDKILLYEPETDFSHDITDYFDLVKSYVERWPADIEKVKIAAVVAPQHKQFADTWETLCVSRGFPYSAFTHLQEAKSWLLKETDSVHNSSVLQ